MKKIQNFLNDEAINDNRELKNRMVKNGENEKIPFDIEVIENSIAFGRDIHKKEVQFLIDIYLKNTGLLNEINGSAVKTQKYKKAAKNSKSNLEFIKVQKEYLIQFLDNERLSVSLGKKEHKKMMKEACQDFKKDLEQIENLNELLSREISGKATQKAYKELYDSEYLEELIKKEEDFERKVSELNLVGKIVNPIYWRIDGMKKVYEIFDKIVKEEYGRSLSKFKTQKSDDEEEEEIEELLEESLEKIIIQEANKEVTTIYEEETDEETYENIDMLLKRRKEKLKKERITTKSKNTKKGGIFGKFTTKK